MDAKILFQSALLRKRSSANFTFERSLASMRAKMSRQIPGTRTRFIARSTHVRCDEPVSSRVTIQSALIIKRFIAHSAFERLLASMDARMSCQITLRRKFFITPFTADTSSSFLLILCVDQDLYCLELPNRSYYSFLPLELVHVLRALHLRLIPAQYYHKCSSSVHSSS